MQILTVNNEYNILVFNIISDNKFIKCSYSFSNTQYPDLNDFIIKAHLKSLNFILSDENFEGVIEQYSYSMPHIFVEDFKNIDINPIKLNKYIYGVDNNDIKNMQIDLREYLNTTIYGQLVIKKSN